MSFRLCAIVSHTVRIGAPLPTSFALTIFKYRHPIKSYCCIQNCDLWHEVSFRALVFAGWFSSALILSVAIGWGFVRSVLVRVFSSFQIFLAVLLDVTRWYWSRRRICVCSIFEQKYACLFISTRVHIKLLDIFANFSQDPSPSLTPTSWANNDVTSSTINESVRQ